MSAWIVYSKDGSIERCKLRSLEYGGTAMGERAVTATFDYHSEVAFEVFDYIEYRGERFELEAVPTVKKLSSFEYQYELRFVSLKYELERCEMRDLVPSDNGVVYPTPLTFSFTGDVRYLTDRIQACLDAMYGTGVWKIIIADETSSEEKNITIAQQNCWNALALVNSTYGLNFYIKGRTITIGGEQPLVSHTFEYGKGNGLYEIERASDTETGIVTKLRAYGSTRNLDYSYPKKPEWSDSVLPVSFALSPLRLMLPSFKTDGKTDYVLADDAAISKYGIREASMVYDDIYPSIAGATYNGQAIDEIKAVDAVDESQKTFVVYLHELGFYLEEHLTTSDAQISMKSGALQGYTFTISSIEKQTGGYKITLGKNSLENSEESGAYVPGVNWNMKAGDKFVLLNILMPQKYIRDAENRLLARANEYLSQYSKTNFSYNIGLHDKFLIQNPSVYDSLIEGSKLKVYDKEIGIDEEVTIQSITITENLEDNILPQVKVTLNNEPSASTLDRIQGKLNEVAAETAANGFTTQSEIMAQYRRKLDKPFFDKLFVAIDANGNEIPSTDVVTPIAYIKAKYHVASVGGFTMYAMDKDVNVPSLASGLPFDGRTIWYNPDTQQIEVIGGTGGGSGEGVSNFWDLSGIPSWITNSKPKYTYSEIEGTPDLSVFATQNWIISQGYASAEELKKYIPISGYTEVSGEKNFTGGLKVNGSPIYYDTEKKYWKLEGDLLVTGGITMYGNEGTYTPSTIMDAIAVDGTTISKSGGVLKVIGGTSGGSVEGLASVAYSGKYDDLIGKPTLLSSFTDDVVSGRYLPLIGGTIDSYFGAFSIKRNAPLASAIKFENTSGILGYIGYNDDYTVQIWDKNQQNSKYILHSGNYSSYTLPLSGGTLTGNLGINASTANTGISISYNGTAMGSLTTNGSTFEMFNAEGYGITTLGTNLYALAGWNRYTLWHSGNDGGGSGLDADLLDGKHLSDIIRYEGLNNNGNGAASAQTITYWGEGNWGHGSTYGTSLNIQGAGSWNHRIDFRTDGILDYYQGINTTDMTHIGTIAFTSSNVASATKLNDNTTFTAWGQTFFTNGKPTSVSGAFNHGHIWIHNNDEINSFVDINANTSATLYLQYRTTGNTILCYGGGNVGVGTENPLYKHHVVGDSYIQGVSHVANYITFDYKDHSINNEPTGRLGTFDRRGGMALQFGTNTSYRRFSIIDQQWTVELFYVDDSGNVFANGGITMYSDKRKKTILNHVELSLKQIADAPLIEHYYNSDDKKTTHVGSIAQYWASMNDWFCKLDSEGYYTMEIQNAALASAISIARELDRYETKTDKTIKKLKKRICELEEEIERLKSA